MDILGYKSSQTTKPRKSPTQKSGKKGCASEKRPAGDTDGIESGQRDHFLPSQKKVGVKKDKKRGLSRDKDARQAVSSVKKPKKKAKTCVD